MIKHLNTCFAKFSLILCYFAILPLDYFVVFMQSRFSYIRSDTLVSNQVEIINNIVYYYKMSVIAILSCKKKLNLKI